MTLQPTTIGQRLLLVAYTAASFLASFLVFLVQPLIARMVLPRLGGSPMVWNTSLVFFQSGLLLGYGYTHLSSRTLSLRRQSLLHIGVLAAPLAVIPIAVPGWNPPSSGSPAVWLLSLLAVSVGLPYVVVTTSSPLMQKWFSASGHPRSHDPYFLYAAGNVGSLSALLGYPFLIEPRLALSDQSKLWAGMYLALVALNVGLVIHLRLRGGASPASLPAADAAAATAAPGHELDDRAPTWRERARWLLLAMVPTSAMMGVSTYLTTDVASVPLLWVLPLAAYLLTFIVAFGQGRRPSRTMLSFAVVAYVCFLAAIRGGAPGLMVVHVGIHLLGLFAIALFCHGWLADTRPRPQHLTGFFLVVSVGGVLGGITNALVAPLVFNDITEYPLVLLGLLGGLAVANRQQLKLAHVGLFAGLAAVLTGAVLAAGPLAILVPLVIAVWVFRNRVGGAAIAAAVGLVAVMLLPTEQTLYKSRSFYGTLRVVERDGFRQIVHGTTVHGQQRISDDTADRPVPTGYYFDQSPPSRLYQLLEGDDRLDHQAMIGLGVGVLASYLETGQKLTYYELDPEVVRVAQDERWFDYLATTRGDVDIKVGDARLELESAPDDQLGLLVVDAFSSDAIPVHLLTVEAIELYQRKLADDGLLLLHISNRHLDLEPVIAALAKETGLDARVYSLHLVKDPSDPHAKLPSTWVVLGPDLGPVLDAPEWKPLRAESGVDAWTDDRSDLVSILNWG